MVPTIKAILFDLDGTLLDTEALSDKAVLFAFKDSLPAPILEERAALGYSLPWEMKKQILGLRGAEWVPKAVRYGQQNWGISTEETATPARPAPPGLEEFWTSWEDNLSSYCDHVTACAGARELVEALAKAGLPIAIATSSRLAGVEKKRMNHQAMFKNISTIIAGDHPAVKKGKPAPDIYLEAARQLGVDPEECLVFEDALSGVRSGKAAGCLVVAIPDPRFSLEERAAFESEADVVVPNLWAFDGRTFGIDVDMKTLRKHLN
jgi:beta-phosphoglucomutase-like phosphatase (HAD superfamily)